MRVYDAYNFMLGDVVNGTSVPANTTVMSVMVPGYLCPSDANPGSSENLAVGFNARVTCVNYAINGGVNRQNNGGCGERRRLVAGRQLAVRKPSQARQHHRRHEQHGRVQRVGQGKVRPERTRSQPGLLDSAIHQRRAQNDYNLCKASTTPLWDFKGEYWTLQDTGRGGPYYHVMPPNQTGLCCRARISETSIRSSAPARFTPAAPTSC